jgi:hypothetical protein
MSCRSSRNFAFEEILDQLDYTLDERVEFGITDVVCRGNDDMVALGTIDCSGTWVDVDTMFSR